MENIFDLLKGRKMKIMTDARVEVILEIESVKTEHHSRQITPDTRENDWWGESVDWNTYKVSFTNGFSKSFDNIIDLKVEDE